MNNIKLTDEQLDILLFALDAYLLHLRDCSHFVETRTMLEKLCEHHDELIEVFYVIKEQVKV